MLHLILPDIHDQVLVADQIISAAPRHDRTILLGDYFDSFGDDAAISGRTATWIKERISDPEFTFLMGNHDISYAYPSIRAYAKCPGWDLEKHGAVISSLTQADFERFAFTHTVNDILFTHAGLTAPFSKFLEDRGHHDGDVMEHLPAITQQAFDYARCGKEHDLLAPIGYVRGGNAQDGSITWADLCEFKPVPGIYQIFGHTPIRQAHFAVSNLGQRYAEYILDGERIPAHRLDEMINEKCGFCLDSHLHTFATYDDESRRLEIYSCTYDRPVGFRQPSYWDRKLVSTNKIFSQVLIPFSDLQSAPVV